MSDMAGELSHYDSSGKERMVDVGGKEPTDRRARAGGSLRVAPETLTALRERTLPKGDPFAVARVAGLMAAKRTSELIPLCHPLRLTHVEVAISVDEAAGEIRVETTAAASERTGVEMEALTACSVALLTLYDMLKAIDRGMVITGIRLLEKTGGKSDYRLDE